MRFKPVFILYILLNFGALSAQGLESCPCCSQNHRAFDYWLGDWEVYNTNGDVLGTNKILKMQAGCVLLENWVGASGSTGTSYNFFDGVENSWNQIWVSNTGGVLRLKGNPNEDGAMVMTSGMVKNPDGDYYNQITWTPNEDGTVTQLWVILNQKKEVINTLFRGIYEKK